VIRNEEEHLAHYGILRRSGRYPWGSGASESTRNRSFLDTIDMLRKDGMSESEIARGFGITTTELRAAKSQALAQQKQEKILTVQRWAEKGLSNVAIGQKMGINESSVRALRAPGEKDKADALQTTASMLKDQVAKKKYIDVGVGVERYVGVTRTRLDTAVAVLKEQGYVTKTIYVEQVNIPGKFTTMKVLAAPGTDPKIIEKNRSEIQQIAEYSDDYGRSYTRNKPPISVSARRVGVNYAEDGGAEADGVIYVRPGVKDLAIGSKRYGQVRVMVDGTHYLKGMAVYKDDLPDGVDLVFNTNKSNTGRKKDVMKEISKDPDFPFGAIVRQVQDSKGNVTSAMNLVNEEGSWDKWSKTISSQMLSKQNPELARQQLGLTTSRRLREFDEINSLTNATVRKELLLKFADSADAASVHLKAANLPRQATKVILPITSIKTDEVYAPSMRDGERVVLVRFPHGGTFEIPELTVNNRNREARKILGVQAQDAIGIHHTVAQRLSGADFDGDTVLVIPNNKRSVKYTPALEGLKGFDPQIYKIPEDSPTPRISPVRMQREMGKISNLITDMTIHGANNEEKARAIRHSMVVIDSEKHGLDFVQSEKDNNIRQLKEKYQGRITPSGKVVGGGAKTLISRARAEVRVPHKIPRPTKLGGPIDPETGKKVFIETGKMIPVTKTIKDPRTGRTIRVETGEMTPKLTVSRGLVETDDAETLSSGTKMEAIYAEHSNRLKALANTARKEAVHIKASPYSPSAKAAYSNEVASLNGKLNTALKNAPLERQAQLIAQTQISQKRQANPHIAREDLKKIKQQQLNEARKRTGAGKTKVMITQDEWNAIQAGAISNDKLEKILKNSDLENIKYLALPKDAPKMSL
jgi:DNA-binding CsgD family transcriptional regulator